MHLQYNLLLAGVTPATEFLKGSGLSMTDRGFVSVNKVGEQSHSIL